MNLFQGGKIFFVKIVYGSLAYSLGGQWISWMCVHAEKAFDGSNRIFFPHKKHALSDG